MAFIYLFRLIFFVLISAMLLIGASACSSVQVSDQPPPPGNAPDWVDTYRIGVDDIVEVTVWRHPELKSTMPVRADGLITIPLVGDIRAGGRTPTEVSEEAREAMSAYIRDPQVTVILTEMRSHEYLSRVRVTGAVRNPVSLPYRAGMTVLDAVLAAGGLTEFAAADRAALHRKNAANKTESYAVYLGAILERGQLASNYSVLPGDVITVPERAF